MAETEVAKQNQQPAIFATLMGENFKKQISTALARHMTPDRFVRVSITAMRRNPKLQQCTIDSVLGCLMDLAAMGLEADGRRAYLVPFDKKNKQGIVQYTECTKIVSYMGLAELAMRSGMVSTIHADVVCEGDIFKYSMGELYDHVPWFLRRDKDKPSEEGDVYAVYAMVKNRDGTTKCEVMSVSEVNKIRDGSQGAKADPWTKHWSEMAKKTAFKRLSKWLVLSPEFRDVSTAEDDDDDNVIETSARNLNHDPSHLTNLIGSGALKGESEEQDEVPEAVDRRKTRKKAESAVETAKEPETPNVEKPDFTSDLEGCLAYMDAEAMNKANGIQYTGRGEDKSIKYQLPDGSVVHIGNGTKIEGGVDTLQPDCLQVTRNILEASRKKARNAT